MKKSLSEEHEDATNYMLPEGGSTVYSEIFDRHIDTVYRVCFAQMGVKQDAEDAAQSVFVKLIESQKSFVDEEHEKAWLITIAQNHCRDIHRKWWKRKVVNLDILAIEKTSESSSILNDMEINLLKLPSSHRLILYLYYYEGYKLHEMASMLNLNLNTLKTKMRKAKKQLKLEIGDDVHGQ